LAVAKTAEDSDGDKALFGRLFSHIKDNDIPMTAPVEMTYVGGPDGQKDPGMERQSMAFYYRDQTVGSAGAAGDVEVVDVPALTVVSIGLKGSYRESDFRKAYAKLLRWLDEHRDEYTATGNVRVLAYNSPFMPFWMKYSEVQVPISKLSKGP
jgi:effector-binding domain-containing protein